GPKGTTDWQRFVIEIVLPDDVSARRILFGVHMRGRGKAWFDDLEIEIDGQRYLDPDHFDLTFESPGLQGLGPSNARVELDPQIAHSGKQSLRVSASEVAADGSTSASALGATAVATQWKAIVAHLEAGRAGYLVAGGSPKDVDWAIQNARI